MEDRLVDVCDVKTTDSVAVVGIPSDWHALAGMPEGAQFVSFSRLRRAEPGSFDVVIVDSLHAGDRDTVERLSRKAPRVFVVDPSGRGVLEQLDRELPEADVSGFATSFGHVTMVTDVGERRAQ